MEESGRVLRLARIHLAFLQAISTPAPKHGQACCVPLGLLESSLVQGLRRSDGAGA